MFNLGLYRWARGASHPFRRKRLIIRDEGQRNVVSLAPYADSVLSGRITVRGDDNVIVIGAGCQAADLNIELGSSCTVTIGETCSLGKLFVYAAKDNTVAVGSNTNIGGIVRLLLHEPGEIKIGAGCLFAGETDISLSDMHSIIDAKTEARINPAADVTIGDRVWVGVRAVVLKGSRIGHDSVIGACAVVSGEIPCHSIAAGAPARVVRSGVAWKHELV